MINRWCTSSIALNMKQGLICTMPLQEAHTAIWNAAMSMDGSIAVPPVIASSLASGTSSAKVSNFPSTSGPMLVGSGTYGSRNISGTTAGTTASNKSPATQQGSGKVRRCFAAVFFHPGSAMQTESGLLYGISTSSISPSGSSSVAVSTSRSPAAHFSSVTLLSLFTGTASQHRSKLGSQ